MLPGVSERIGSQIVAEVDAVPGHQRPAQPFTAMLDKGLEVHGGR
jgi:hypothetical protein